jgi:tryptophanyl-tRNA synthetase
MKGRIFSGIKPSGNLHLGNYLGAIRNWVRLQGDYDAIYCVVDQHAITVPQDPATLRERSIEIAAGFLASGLDAEKNAIFVQSHVAAHAQLAWVFNCLTPLGWQNRMTQFKDKAGKHREQASAGLYTYPTLMAADILLYKATHVPVGDDQKQHVELARDIAGAFNHRFETEFFPLPEPVIQGDAARIMSLRDGTKKMSSSEASEQSRINMTDDADTIAQKIKRAKSDSQLGLSFEPEERPEASNLLMIYAGLAEEPIAKVAAEFAETPFADFKTRLADLAVERLGPITAEMRRLMTDPGEVEAVLRRGADKVEAIAADNLAKIYDIVGFLPR